MSTIATKKQSRKHTATKPVSKTTTKQQAAASADVEAQRKIAQDFACAESNRLAALLEHPDAAPNWVLLSAQALWLRIRIGSEFKRTSDPRLPALEHGVGELHTALHEFSKGEGPETEWWERLAIHAAENLAACIVRTPYLREHADGLLNLPLEGSADAMRGIWLHWLFSTKVGEGAASLPVFSRAEMARGLKCCFAKRAEAERHFTESVEAASDAA